MLLLSDVQPGSVLSPPLFFSDAADMGSTALLRVSSLQCVEATLAALDWAPCVAPAAWWRTSLAILSTFPRLQGSVNVQMGSASTLGVPPLPEAYTSPHSQASGVSFSLALTLTGVTGLNASAVVPIRFVDLRASAPPLPSIAPSPSPLVAPSQTPTRSAAPTPSVTARPSRSPGASPSATPSNSPEPLPYLTAFPGELASRFEVGNPSTMSDVHSILVFSAAAVQWGVRLNVRGTQQDWLSVTPNAKAGGDANQQRQTVRVSVNGAGLGPGVHRATITVYATNGASSSSGPPGRLSIADLLPVNIPVTVTVVGAAMRLTPAVLQRNVIPGQNGTQSWRIANTGSSTLTWSLRTPASQAPVAWLAVCSDTRQCAYAGNATAHAQLHANMQTQSTGGPLFPLTATSGLSGSVPVGQAVQLTAWFVSPDASASGLFEAELLVLANVFDPLTSLVKPPQRLKVTMRSTLLSVVPSTVQVRVQPGSLAASTLNFQTLTSDADLTVQVLGNSGAMQTEPWLRLVSGAKGEFDLAAGHGQVALRVGVQHGGQLCAGSEGIPESALLCGHQAVSTNVLVRITAALAEGASAAADPVAIAAYSEVRAIPVVVTVVPGALSAEHSEARVPAFTQTSGQQLVRSPNSTDFTNLAAARLVAVSGGRDLPFRSIGRDASDVGVPSAGRFLPQVDVLRGPGFTPISVALSQLEGGNLTYQVGHGSPGVAVLGMQARGRPFRSLAAPARQLAVMHMTSPACPAPAQQLSQNGIECVCAPGWQVKQGEAEASDSLVCEACPDGTIRESAEDPFALCRECPPGTFADQAGLRCIACPSQGIDCAAGQFKPRKGFWCDTCSPADTFAPSNPRMRRAREVALAQAAERAGITRALGGAGSRRLQAAVNLSLNVDQSLLGESTLMMECAPTDACVPAQNGTAVQCAPGHRGVLCGECMDGWARSSPQVLCTQCPNNTVGVLLGVGPWVVFTLALLAMSLNDKGGSSSREKGQGTFVGIFRILTGWAQMYAVLLSTRLPPQSQLDDVMASLSSVSMGVSTSSVGTQCAVPLSFYFRLYVTLMLPGVALLVPVVVACACGNRSAGMCSASKRQTKPGSESLVPEESTAVAVRYSSHSDQSGEDGDSPGDDSLADSPRKWAVAVADEGGAGKPSGVLTAAPTAAAPAGGVFDPLPRSESAMSPTASAFRKGVSGAKVASSPGDGVHGLDDTAGAAEPPAKPDQDSARWQRILQQRAFRAAFILLLLVHFPVVDACLRMLDTLDSMVYGFTLLRVDVGHGSMDAQFAVAQLVAWLGLVVFGVGIPLGSALLICRRRHEVHLPRVQRVFGAVYEGFRIPDLPSRGEAPTHAAFLKHAAKQPNYWFWELLVVLPRKVLLAVIAVVVRAPVLQASLISIVLVTSLVVHVAAKPFRESLLNTVETLALVTICLASFGGLSLGDAGQAGTNTTFILQVSISLANAMFLAFTLCATLVYGCGACARSRKTVDTWLQLYVSQQKGDGRKRAAPALTRWCRVLGCWRSTAASLVAVRALSLQRGMQLAGDKSLLPSVQESLVASATRKERR